VAGLAIPDPRSPIPVWEVRDECCAGRRSNTVPRGRGLLRLRRSRRAPVHPGAGRSDGQAGHVPVRQLPGVRPDLSEPARVARTHQGILRRGIHRASEDELGAAEQGLRSRDGSARRVKGSAGVALRVPESLERSARRRMRCRDVPPPAAEPLPRRRDGDRLQEPGVVPRAPRHRVPACAPRTAC
jgi:hypothetical protein